MLLTKQLHNKTAIVTLTHAQKMSRLLLHCEVLLYMSILGGDGVDEKHLETKVLTILLQEDCFIHVIDTK